jgi:gliding motility-associated-like protein
VKEPGFYSLQATDANGCKGIDSVEVIGIACNEGVYIPNAFTPNNDGLNDQFRATAYGQLSGFGLEVYNRMGERIFSTSDITRGWDGRYRGKPMAAGNYVWYCRYQLEGRSPAVQKGNVLLIR